MAGPIDDVADGKAEAPASVLFVCRMNAIRSPMAEYLARRILGKSIYVKSAGASAGDPDPFAQTVMSELGIPMGDHVPTALDDLADNYFDLIVTLSPEAHHRALELTRAQSVKVEYWPIMDPSIVAGSREQILAAYRQVRDTLEDKIRRRLAPAAVPVGEKPG